MNRKKWSIIQAIIASGQTEKIDTYGLLYEAVRSANSQEGKYYVRSGISTNMVSKKLPEEKRNCKSVLIPVSELGLFGANIPYIKIWKAALEQGLLLFPEDVPLQFCLSKGKLPKRRKVWFAVDVVTDGREFPYYAFCPSPNSEDFWTLCTFNASNLHDEFTEDDLFMFWVPDEESK